MKAMTKAALFGGALFAAGITASADAQWNLDENYSFHRVFAGLGGTGDSGFNYGTGSSYVIFGGTMQGTGYASLSDSLMRAEIDITGSGFGNARSIAYATVDAPKKIYADWDFTGYQPGAYTYSLIQIQDLTNGGYLINQGPGTSGAGVSINLLPGVDYRMIVLADADAPANLWAQFSKGAIPAPGSLALLGVAAIGARRRRRT